MKRFLLGIAIVVAVAGCAKNDSDPISQVFKKTATQKTCTQAFEKYGRAADSFDTAQTNKAIEEFYTIAPLACPTHAIWDDTARTVAPGSVVDWADRYERTTVWKGQCQNIEDLKLTAPACE